MQNHYNLLYREEEREMIPQCVDMGVGLLPWSPLARGLLARPSGEAQTTARAQSDTFTPMWYGAASDTTVIDAVGDIAAARGVPRAQVALAWLMSKEGVVAPIVGTTRSSHLEDALGSVTLRLSEEEVAALEAPYTTRPVAGH